eukprot:TRINITY_DN12434_c0_g1_i1.p1 TRINITY_DN12434_c0_g1~~TRINITY_DN12434_c0_g1_i1.p1  ORF type:complete len:101 (-),score=12.14 TRINITY_DN12434_c0_g1_i1:72-374(-)
MRLTPFFIYGCIMSVPFHPPFPSSMGPKWTLAANVHSWMFKNITVYIIYMAFAPYENISHRRDPRELPAGPPYDSSNHPTLLFFLPTGEQGLHPLNELDR